MEPAESLLVEMRRAYRDELGPPNGASDRVLRNVVATRRVPIVVWLGVPLVAAAALTLMWCVPRGTVELAADRHVDEAVYRGDDRPPVETTTRAHRPATPTPVATLPAPSARPPEAIVPSIEARPRRRADAVRPAAPEPPPVAAPPAVVDGPRIEALAVALQGVERNLRAERPDLALATLARLRDELEAADLGEEHDALRLLALCASRPDETAAPRARFAAEFPRSLYAARIAQSCEKSGGPQ